ncbi:type II toxin-antitoxin system RelE/ParE family toxin [Pedobacter sp. BS3]|uniref:type II toxin-antitoxin system RelE family toxin n=1 Tax=Pedobacter sp. BS3 TaxID=2567937 RepID=UPI0011ED8A02|nr:type II toxin-antitoxin system RelE/ParE family toxin [Pedobacter sp. BS3]TZF83051.1 type II toxin-antitoxin system RelE/ParE family toxin [Pedobacter sp. BS3]
MNLKIDRRFEKDTDKIKDSKILSRIAVCIEQVSQASSISDIPSVKKLTGFKNHYRIKIGDYRAGILISDDEVLFERFLHRKDIYKYYP